MTVASTADAARLPLMLTELRLPTIARLWPDITARADKEEWPAARLLAALAELELADRAADMSSATSPRPACRPARRWPPSTSPPCRC